MQPMTATECQTRMDQFYKESGERWEAVNAKYRYKVEKTIYKHMMFVLTKHNDNAGVSNVFMLAGFHAPRN